MVREFRRNHEVPRFLLSRWHVDAAERDGVWVFVIPKQGIELSTDRGKKPYSFAISNDLYVGNIGGKRVTEAEEWLSRCEGVCAELLAHAENGIRDPITMDEVVQVIRAIVGMHFRSHYEITQIASILRWRPDVCEALGISVSSLEEARTRAIENCINATDRQMRSLMPYPVVDIVTDISHDLLLCDRPILEIDTDELSMPLGPRAAVVVRKGSPDNWGVFVNSCPGKGQRFVEQLNQFSVDRARRWIVGVSRQQLEEIAPRLSISAVEEREQRERLGMLPRLSSTWWTIPTRGNN